MTTPLAFPKALPKEKPQESIDFILPLSSTSFFRDARQMDAAAPKSVEDVGGGPGPVAFYVCQAQTEAARDDQDQAREDALCNLHTHAHILTHKQSGNIFCASTDPEK